MRCSTAILSRPPTPCHRCRDRVAKIAFPGIRHHAAAIDIHPALGALPIRVPPTSQCEFCDCNCDFPGKDRNLVSKGRTRYKRRKEWKLPRKEPGTLLESRSREVLNCAFEPSAFYFIASRPRASPIQNRVARNVLARSPDFMLEHNPFARNAGDFIDLLSTTRCSL